MTWRGYPEVPVRAKLGLAPWFALLVVAGGVAQDRGWVDLRAGPLPHHHRSPTIPPPPVSRLGRADIPPAYLALYRSAAATCPGLSWAVLAGIGKEETNHGRSTLPGVRSGANFAGAMGPMQFLAGTWAEYGRGGDVYDPRDAVPGAARLLCANGARDGRDVPGAVYAYNHAWWYVRAVLDFARAYERK